MIQFIRHYLIFRNLIYWGSMAKIDEGIRQFLADEGIAEDRYDSIVMRRTAHKLNEIDREHIYLYFDYYPQISKIKQLCAEYQRLGFLTAEKKAELQSSLNSLHIDYKEETFIPLSLAEKILKEV